MSQLPGYCTGGTIHIVVNNQIGFTTLPADARSTDYCTDIAKMIEAPIFHVNGEDPIAVMEMAKLALEFRQEFGRDVVIDIYCYRRHGHNEGDEPAFTQPDLYNKIKQHPLPSEVFLQQIAPLNTLTAEDAAALKAESHKELDEALSKVKGESENGTKSEFAGSTAIFQPPYTHDVTETAISPGMLEQIVKALTTVPDDFHVLPKIKRILLERRLQVWKAGSPYNWSFAEALAFGSLLLEGTPVRLSGQDSRRGTFSQRHSVLYDEQNRQRYIPLNHLARNQAKFCVYNSPLSEYAVLGFDYGYSMDYPSMLCLWEAQFGDFANGAQIIIDQFIAASESKWRRPSSIVLLLPHGYEGQGPEHSSARLERYLQLCAEENMQVCNLTTPRAVLPRAAPADSPRIPQAARDHDAPRACSITNRRSRKPRTSPSPASTRFSMTRKPIPRRSTGSSSARARSTTTSRNTARRRESPTPRSSASSSCIRSSPRSSSASRNATPARKNSSGARRSRRTWAHGLSSCRAC